MNIYDIIEWFDSFDGKGKESSLEDITSDSSTITIVKKSPIGLNIEVGFPFYKLLYDKKAKFLLLNKELNIRINHFLANYHQQDLSKRICEAYIFERENFDSGNKYYFKYYSKINDSFLLNFLEKGKNEFNVTLNSLDFKIYIDLAGRKKNYLVIESNQEINFKNFKNAVNCIILSIGYFTGYYFKKEEFYFQSTDNKFTENIGFFYRGSHTSHTILEPITVYPISYLSNLPNDKELEYASCISVEQFQKFTNLIKENSKIYSAVRLLFDIYKGSSISRVSLLFVILETIVEEYSKKINKDVKGKTIKEDAKQTLLKYEDKIDEHDYDKLITSLGYIEKKEQNNKKTEALFKHLRITLSVEDRKIIGKRNEFFHGKIINTVFTNKINFEEDYHNLELEYEYYSYRLYVLISKILLKKINFSGYIINYPKIKEEETNKVLDEDYFIKI